ncbi:MAG: M42 family metallopeptidase [Oscillospiraceae bacterium]
MNSLKMIEEFSNAHGVSGFEDEVVALGRKYAPKKSALKEDSLRNLYIWNPEDEKSGKPVVQLDAHTDEVGFMVQAIRPNGLLQIIPLGGWVEYTIPAHRVMVKNREGKYLPGIIATKPPHYMTEGERRAPLDIGQMCIDMGVSSAYAIDKELNIGIGAPVVPDTVFEYNENTGIMMGKAFDCRVGCACMMEVMSRLQDKKLPVRMVGALSSQEEVGTRGARVTANAIRPDIALVFEGVPADDSFAPEYAAQSVMGKGPMLRHADKTMITNPRFQRFALSVAEKQGIPVQEAVRTGGGTNGAVIHLAAQGVPCIVIGVPVRYPHTHYGYASYADYQNSVKLGIAVIQALNAETIAEF